MLFLKPYLIQKPWGGEHFKKAKITSLEQVGELILASTIDTFPTYLTYENKDYLFREYWEGEGYQKALDLGYKPRYTIDKKAFPLLIKILSTKQPLSLQLHPSTNDLKNIFHKDQIGKEESWLIFNSGKNSQIFLGLKEKLKQPSLLFKHQNPLTLLNTFEPKSGDIFNITPGLIHGTKGDILFYEIQQPSDITFRVYDFNRDRELHKKQSELILKERHVKPSISNYKQGITSLYFSLSTFNIQTNKLEINSPFAIITYIGNPIMIKYNKKEIQPLRWGETFLAWRNDTIEFIKEIDLTQQKSCETYLINNTNYFLIAS